MSDKIKLFNKGKSTIHYGEAPKFDENHKLIAGVTGTIKPDECVAFEPEMAKKLKRLYPKTMLSLDDVRDQFESKHAEKVPEDLKDIVASAVAKAVAEALAARDAAEAEKVEETEDELLARLEKERAEEEAKKAEEKAKKEIDK